MRPSMCALLALACVVAQAAPGRAATDFAAMQPSEIEALQKRLTDASCYHGTIDGRASAATATAVQACPDQAPVLRIETGMHTAAIRRIGVDSACRLLATGSGDKTVRLWSLPEGRLLRTVRPPIGDGEGGKVTAVALSPDGRTLAAGGWDAAWDRNPANGHGLYLVDTVGGELRRIGAFESDLKRIAFSTDGTRVAIGLGSSGVRVLERDTGRELMADRDYGGQVYGIAFAPDGALLTTSFDGSLRRYGLDLRLTAKVRAPDGGRPYGIAVSPDSHRAAVGYSGSPHVAILNAVTMKRIAEGDTADLSSGTLSSVAWSADGRLAVGGGAQTYASDEWKTIVRRLGPDGKRLGADVPAADDSVLDIQPCAAGLAFVAGDPRIGLLNARGAPRSLQGPVTADMRGKRGDAFTISADAAAVRFGLGQRAAQPVRFDLGAGTLADDSEPAADLRAPDTSGLPVTGWENGTAPEDGAKALGVKPYEVSRALAVRPDRAGFALSSDFNLRAYDAAGELRWRVPVPETAWGVNLSADGRVVVAAYGDGTVRWHRWSDGQELLALFVHAATRRWVAWTSTGYYMASPGGEDLIGWHVNRGWAQEADFFPASRFRDRFNRPDVVRAVLTTLDERAALRQADEAAHRRPDDARPLIEHLPPVVSILSPAADASVPPGPVELRYSVRLPSGGALSRVEAFVDGAKIEARGLARPGEGAATVTDGALTLPMPAHDASLSLVAYGADGKASDAAVLALKSAAPAPAPQAFKPALYALLVGVSHYQDKRYDLGYAAADARGFADALKAQEGRLYGHVEIKVLADGDATAVGLKRGLSWLRRQTTAHDLAIVFAAGHGTTDAKGKFWFLPSDMDSGDIDATAVSQDEIANVLYDLPGKKLMFLDACNSGAALSMSARGGTDVSTAVSDFAQAEGGVVAYAASTGREFSFERSEWSHGAFTKALIEGFGGGADLVHDGTITTGTLDLFVERRVRELTGGQQHAVMTRPKTVPDFPIALSR